MWDRCFVNHAFPVDQRHGITYLSNQPHAFPANLQLPAVGYKDTLFFRHLSGLRMESYPAFTEAINALMLEVSSLTEIAIKMTPKNFRRI